MKIKGLIIAAALVALFVAFTSAYTVDETEQVVITRFGKVIGEAITEPGLHFKMPAVDIANSFPKNLQEWDGERGEIPTRNKTYIWVDVFARWRIEDPYRFFQTCINMRGAIIRIGDIIDPALKNAIASYDLIETVRNTNRTMAISDDGPSARSEESKTDQISHKILTGRKVITDMVLKNAKEKLSSFGIDIVDVQIKRINYRDDVRKSVYDRMIAERTQIVEKFRSEGRGEAQKIRGDKEKELKRIESGAYKTAQELMGTADAEVTSIYADAYGKDPEFYSFLKTLEMYENALGKNTSIVLSTDSEFLRFLKARK